MPNTRRPLKAELTEMHVNPRHCQPLNSWLSATMFVTSFSGSQHAENMRVEVKRKHSFKDVSKLLVA